MLKTKLKALTSVNWSVIIFFLCSWLAVYLLSQQPKTQEFFFVDSPFIPQDAVFIVSLPTQFQEWKSLQQWGTSELQKALITEGNKITKNLVTPRTLQLINQWVDQEITLMYLGQDLPENISEPISFPRLLLEEISQQKSLAAIIPLKNLLVVRPAWKQIKTKLPGTLQIKNYQNIQYFQIKDKNYPAYCLTILGRSIIITTDVKSIEKIINAYNNQTHLSIPPGYEEAIKQINVIDPLARFYVNIPKLFEIAAPYSSGLVFPDQIQQQNKQGIAGTISLEEDGLRVEGILWERPETFKKATKKEDLYSQEIATQIMTQRLPRNTKLLLIGGNIHQIWQTLVTESESNPLLPLDLQPAILTNWIKSMTGLQWEKDFLPWIGDQGVLAMIPTPSLQKITPKEMWVMMLQVSDRFQAEKLWRKLDQIVATRHKFQVKSRRKNEYNFTQWLSQPKENSEDQSENSAVLNTKEMPKILFSHGWLEGNVLFLIWGNNELNQIIPEPRLNLNSNPRFQKVILSGLNPNQGQLFLNLENDHQIPLIDLRGRKKMLADAINNLGFTVSRTEREQMRWKLILNLKKSS